MSKRVQLGPLALPPPRVVGTIADAATLAAYRSKPVTGCDVVEVRLDQLGLETEHWLEQSKTIEAGGKPVIFTLRLAAEGGNWRRPDAERAGYYRTALEHLAAIDVELQSVLVPKLAPLAREQRKTLIVSAHDFTKTPSLHALRDTVFEGSRYGHVVKIATMITGPGDMEILRQLLADDWGVPLCVLGMGPTSESTRTEFPRLGSVLTYGYLDRPTAPGQPRAADLMERLGEAAG